MNKNFRIKLYFLPILTITFISPELFAHGKYQGDNVVNLDPSICRPAESSTQSTEYQMVANGMLIFNDMTVYCPLPERALSGYGDQAVSRSLHAIKKITMQTWTLSEEEFAFTCMPFSLVIGNQGIALTGDSKWITASQVTTALTWDNPFSYELDTRLVKNYGIECRIPPGSYIYNIEMTVSEED